MFTRIVFYTGLLSMLCAAVIVFAVLWATARDALRRRMRLHQLRVVYSRASARAREVQRLEGWWRLPEVGR